MAVFFIGHSMFDGISLGLLSFGTIVISLLATLLILFGLSLAFGMLFMDTLMVMMGKKSLWKKLLTHIYK